MITLIVLYVVIGIGGGYGIKKGADVYLHLDDNDVKRYESCVNKAENLKQCGDLE